MKKQVIIIIAIIIAIVLGIIVALNIGDDNTEKVVSQNVIKNNIANKDENKIENKIENNVDSKENIVDEENNEKANTSPTEEGKDTKVEETDIEKAISIVKQKWGEDSSVKFVDETDTTMSDGEFIICVREIRTTNALMWYKVNIKDGTCEEW